MIFFGIDPGGMIGFAAVTSSGEVLFTKETDDILEVFDTIIGSLGSEPVAVVIEDYLGAGPRSKDGHHTSLQIGYIWYSCQAVDIPCERVGSQRRLAYVDRASQHTTNHARSALAHAFAEMEKQQHGT